MLKNRIISALVLFFLFVPLLWFSHMTFLLNSAVALLAAIAVYEALVSTKYIEGKSLVIISMIFAAIIPFVPTIGVLIPNLSDKVSYSITVIFFTFTIWTDGFIHWNVRYNFIFSSIFSGVIFLSYGNSIPLINIIFLYLNA